MHALVEDRPDIDLVLADVRMPGMTGIELARRINVVLGGQNHVAVTDTVPDPATTPPFNTDAAYTLLHEHFQRVRTEVGALVLVPTGPKPLVLPLLMAAFRLAAQHGIPLFLRQLASGAMPLLPAHFGTDSQLLGLARPALDIPELDVAVPEIRANQAWTLLDPRSQPVQGKHVLIGIVDTGIDYHNPDFKNPDGSTRIKYIWDQTQAGNPPNGYFFGYECDQASINSGKCPEKDTDGHGTHVAGIAAGNGLSSNPPHEIGVAPQADLIMVKSDLSTLGVLAGWQYLVDKARQLGEPIVINDSFGSQAGPHDGTEVEAQTLNLLSGHGVIFVKSVGNAGVQGAHTDGNIVQGGTTLVPFDASGFASTMQVLPKLSVALFYPAGDTLRFSLLNNDINQLIGPIGPNGHVDPVFSGGANVWRDDRPWSARS